RESKKLLTIILKNKVKISKREGKELLLYFDASLEIANVTQKVFGADKYREFTRKQGISVAKTSVHILFDASGSQILVPESQISPVEEELVSLKEKANPQEEFAKPPKYIKNSNQGDIKNTTLRRRRIKPPLQMTSSTEKPGASKTLENEVDNAVSLKSRPSEERNRGDNTDKHIETDREKTENKDIEFPNQNFNIVINKKLTKQKSSSSISDDNSQEMGKVQYGNEIMQHNKIHKAEVEVCKRNKQQLNHSKHLEEKNTENTKQSDWHIESETTLKSVLNKKVEESVICRKKYILSKDVNTAICDKSPSPRKNAESHRKSGERLTSEFNSWDLKQKKMREKSKGKGFTDAAESLISQINKRYKPKDGIKSTRKLKESLIDSGFSNKSDLQLSKEKVQKKSYRQLKTTFVNVTAECPLNDVYNFNLNGADEPIIKLGTVTNHKKKNLFSDSDTEYKCDDSKTDISWLREPKSKPQLIDYSRNKNVKKHKSGKSRPSLERGQPRSKMTPNKNITKKVDETVPEGRMRLPRRAAETKKNYKDLSNSESESEQEFSRSFKEKVKEKIHSRRKTMKLPKKQQNPFTAETQEDVSKEWKNSPLLKDTIRDNNLDLSPAVTVQKKFMEIEPPHMKIIFEAKEGKVIQHLHYPCLVKEEGKYGPTQHLSRKRMYIEDNLSNPGEAELEEEEERANLLPKKVSKGEGADHHTWKVSESISPLSTNDFCIPGENWETEISGIGTMCEEFNTEFRRKVHIRHKMMDYFTKQSWKTAQQHIKTVDHQIQEYRIKKLDKFQLIIIEELENFEKDSQSLKDLEKEFVGFWEKVFQKFSAYHKSEQQRLHLLKASLEKNVFYNTDYEETIFTSESYLSFCCENFIVNFMGEIIYSQMCLMKENMKMLQDRLLKEMQEEQLLNVRRGLMSLFMAHERNNV
ncbi:hypothetical protein EI555_018067, partial [Monodon monoceros]